MIRDSFCVNDSDVVGGELLIFVNGLNVVDGELSSYLYSSSRVHSSNVNRRSMRERNLQKLFLEKNRTSEVTVAEIDVMHNGINIPVIRDSSNKSVVFWAGAVRSRMPIIIIIFMHATVIITINDIYIAQGR